MNRSGPRGDAGPVSLPICPFWRKTDLIWRGPSGLRQGATLRHHGLRFRRSGGRPGTCRGAASRLNPFRRGFLSSEPSCSGDDREHMELPQAASARS